MGEAVDSRSEGDKGSICKSSSKIELGMSSSRFGRSNKGSKF